MPESKGGECERERADAFAENLNRAEGTSFVHVRCLDVPGCNGSDPKLARGGKQPEALYRDEVTGQELVIEHKSVLFPAKYAAFHRNDHEIRDRISRAFDGVSLKRAFKVTLSYLFGENSHTKKERARACEEYAGAVVETIRWAADNLRDDQEIRGETAGRPWVVGLMQDDDWNDGDVWTDLNFIWPIRHPSSAAVRAEVVPQLVRFYAACAAKFRGYPEARRVLVLYWHGEIYPFHLKELLAEVEKPPEVDEVWVPFQDEDVEGNIVLWFERLVPPPVEGSSAT